MADDGASAGDVGGEVEGALGGEGAGEGEVGAVGGGAGAAHVAGGGIFVDDDDVECSGGSFVLAGGEIVGTGEGAGDVGVDAEDGYAALRDGGVVGCVDVVEGVAGIDSGDAVVGACRDGGGNGEGEVESLTFAGGDIQGDVECGELDG